MINRKQIFTAGFWIVGAFGLSQLLRLGSNLIVTRLLVPEMFGLMAIVYVVLYGIAMFSDLGLWAFIVRHKDANNEKLLDTVWTIQVVRGWIMLFVIAVFAGALIFITKVLDIDIGGVYGDEQLPSLLIIVGLTAMINGYKTMAPAIESRKLNRGRLEVVDLIAQIFGTSVMLALAWHFRSIWALGAASIIATIVNVALTYKIFSYRHHLAWNKEIVKEVFAFGKWIFIASALTYLAQQGDKLIFASHISAAELGVYSIAIMLIGAIEGILEQLNYKIGFPLLCEIVNSSPNKLKEKYYYIRLRMDLFIFIIIGILIAIAPTIIEFLYDERYSSAGQMMQILSFSLIGVCMSKLGLECLSALNITKIRMKVMLCRFITVFIGLPILFNYYGLLGAIWGVVIGGVAGLPVQYIEMNKQNIFSLYLEIRVLPMILVSYILTSLAIDYSGFTLLIIDLINEIIALGGFINE